MLLVTYHQPGPQSAVRILRAVEAHQTVNFLITYQKNAVIGNAAGIPSLHQILDIKGYFSELTGADGNTIYRIRIEQRLIVPGYSKFFPGLQDTVGTNLNIIRDLVTINAQHQVSKAYFAVRGNKVAAQAA